MSKASSVKLLPKFSEMRRTFARQNLSYFSRHLGFRNAPFHDRWYDLLQPKNDSEHFSPLKKHLSALKRYHLEGPRKHGKSQCVSINYPAWLIGNFHDIHILIVSKTATLAEQSLIEITQLIEGIEPRSRAYQEVFGNLKPDSPQKWTTDQIFIKRSEVSKFPTIHATGLYGPLTGEGYDLIIADDIIDEENVISRLQIEKASTWFRKVLLTTLFPWGACLVIGTRWHYDDLYSHLLKIWKCEVLKAIQNEEEYVKGKPAEVLWKEQWPIERLEAKRRDIGTIFFNCQYQNDPAGMEGTLLKTEWLKPYDKLPSNLEMFAGVDPALGEGDLQAIATVGYDNDNRQGYLIDVWTGKELLPSFYRKLHELHKTHHYVRIVMESNAFQKVLVNQPELRGLPVVGTTTVRDKQSRFIAMSSHFESKRILVNPLLLGHSEFHAEWIQFPKATYDDALDAVEIATHSVISYGPIEAYTAKRPW